MEEVFASDKGENLTVEVEKSGEMFQQAYEQQEPLNAAQIAEVERERFECYVCNAMFLTRYDITQHGLSKHQRHDVIKRGNPRDTEH